MKKKKWPFVYVAVITVLTYIPILLKVVYSFNASTIRLLSCMDNTLPARICALRTV